MQVSISTHLSATSGHTIDSHAHSLQPRHHLTPPEAQRPSVLQLEPQPVHQTDGALACGGDEAQGPIRGDAACLSILVLHENDLMGSRGSRPADIIKTLCFRRLNTESLVKFSGQARWWTTLFSALGSQRQVNLCEFQINLFHTVNSRPAKATQWDLILKKKEKKKQKCTQNKLPRRVN